MGKKANEGVLGEMPWQKKRWKMEVRRKVGETVLYQHLRVSAKAMPGPLWLGDEVLPRLQYPTRVLFDISFRGLAKMIQLYWRQRKVRSQGMTTLRLLMWTAKHQSSGLNLRKEQMNRPILRREDWVM